MYSYMYLRKDLTGETILWLTDITLFSVFPNTMAYENTQNNISMCHQFGIYTTFTPHDQMLRLKSKKFGGYKIPVTS